jgi:hypothetical protein
MTRPPDGDVSATGQDQRPLPEPSFVIDEAKLHAPPSRQGIVARSALVDRLGGWGSFSVMAVVAPAGYGKTTLLSQWAERIGTRVAWLSADGRDNDPAHLSGPRRGSRGTDPAEGVPVGRIPGDRAGRRRPAG